MRPTESESMPVEFEVKIMKLGTAYGIIIPKPVISGFKLEKGSKLKMTVIDGEISLKKI